MILVDSPAQVVKQLLLDLSLGATPDNSKASWQVFVSSEPNVPDNCITVYNTTPMQDARIMVDGEAQYHYGFQVRIRSVDNPTGWAKGNAILNGLTRQVTRRNVTVAVSGRGYVVQCIAKPGGLLDIGKDSANSKRSLFTLNATITLYTILGAPLNFSAVNTPPNNVGIWDEIPDAVAYLYDTVTPPAAHLVFGTPGFTLAGSAGTTYYVAGLDADGVTGLVGSAIAT